MKVLLTGGSGFLGCELCNELLQVGHEVVVLDDHSRGRPARLERFGDKVKLVDGEYVHIPPREGEAKETLADISIAKKY